jgi:hypothetical protein
MLYEQCRNLSILDWVSLMGENRLGFHVGFHHKTKEIYSIVSDTQFVVYSQ